MKTHHLILLVLAIVLIGGFFLWPQIQTGPIVDELSGTWRAESSPEGEYPWWMVYEFEGNDYTLTTGSDYQEQGTYEITERVLDGSILVKKVYADGTKEYVMTVLTSQEDLNVISIEGVQLYRQ